MKTIKLSLLSTIACLMFASGTRAQAYKWDVTHSSIEGVFRYSFSAIDSWGEVVTVAGVRQNDTLKTNDRNVIIFCHSTDGGKTWTEQDPGLPHFKISGLHWISKVQQIDSLNTVGIGDSGVVVRTTDGGNTWVKQDLPTNGKVADVDFSDPTTGIATSVDSNDIFTTKDGGNHWELAPFHPWYTPTQCHCYGNGHFLVCIVEGFTVYSTNDSWQTFDSLPPIIPWDNKNDVIGIGSWQFRGSDTIVAFGGDGARGSFEGALIVTSTDGGQTWVNTHVTDSVVLDLASMSALDRDLVFCVGSTSLPHLLSSTDHGITWSLDTIVFDTTGYMPQFITGVTMTTNANAVTIFGPGFLALGIPISAGVSNVGINSQQVTIYPNPAAQSITVSDIPGNGYFSVFDILGREVLHGTVPASGTLSLDVSTLPAGLYYVTDGHSQAKFLKE